MEFWLLFGISTVLLLSVNGIVNLPQVVLKHGPLYKGLQHLIDDEKLNSEMIWKDTQTHIDAHSKALHTTIKYMHNYEQIIDAKFKQLHEMEHYEAMQQCYTQYERQIARFNRDLIVKYRLCRHALNSSLWQLEEEIKYEMFYIRDAAIEVQEVAYDCNVTDVRRSAEDRFDALRITMCVMSRLGDIKQQTLEATQICLDAISRVVVSDMADYNDNELLWPNGDNVCLEFGKFRTEFDLIYDRIMMCVKDV